MLIPKGFCAAEVIIVDVVPVNKVVIVAHDPDLADYFDVRAELLQKLALYRGNKIFAALNAASCRLDERPLSEVVVPRDPDKTEHAVAVKNYRPYSLPVVVGIFKRPLFVFEFEPNFRDIVRDFRSHFFSLLGRVELPQKFKIAYGGYRLPPVFGDIPLFTVVAPRPGDIERAVGVLVVFDKFLFNVDMFFCP